MRTEAVPLLLPLIAVGCAARTQITDSSDRSALRERGVLFARVRQIGDNGLLCVVNTRSKGAQWFLLTRYGRANLTIESAATCMGRVEELSASPDGKYVAVVSVGEGHPVLEVVDLRALLDEDKFQVIHTVDPYPGAISIDRWEDGRLVVKSDMLLTHRNRGGRVHPSLYMPGWEAFVLNPDTGRIDALGARGKAPVAHYARELTKSAIRERSEAVWALRALGSGEVVPHLRGVLAREENAELQDEIRQAIEVLSK